jgi:membrane protein
MRKRRTPADGSRGHAPSPRRERGAEPYVANLNRYDQIYGQVGAIVVLMLWLYVTGLMVLIGAEMNAVLARMVEERKGTKIVQQEASPKQNGT